MESTYLSRLTRVTLKTSQLELARFGIRRAEYFIPTERRLLVLAEWPARSFGASLTRDWPANRAEESNYWLD